MLFKKGSYDKKGSPKYFILLDIEMKLMLFQYHYACILLNILIAKINIWIDDKDYVLNCFLVIWI